LRLKKTMEMQNELNSLDQVESMVQQEAATILYFYNDNCAPCHSLRPKVIKMVEEEFPKMKLAFINSEKYPELPARYQVFANPTLLLFFDGREFKRESKYISIPQLSEQIERPYKLIFEN